MTKLLVIVLALGACQGVENVHEDLSSSEMPVGARPSSEPVVKDGVQEIRASLTCYGMSPNFPFLCDNWGPTAPAGFSWTHGDNNCYAGEIVICDHTNRTGWCFYGHPGPTITDNVFGDMDTTSNNIKSYCSRTTNGGGLYNGANLSTPYAPDFWAIFAGTDSVNNFTNFQPSSGQFKN